MLHGRKKEKCFSRCQFGSILPVESNRMFDGKTRLFSEKTSYSQAFGMLNRL